MKPVTTALHFAYKLHSLIRRMANANGAKYLIGLNLKKLNESGKPEGVEPRTYYQGLQEQAKKGPIFGEATLKVVEALDLDLEKNELQWFATNFETSKKAPELEELRSTLDYLRAEKPELHGLTFDAAAKASKVWHRRLAKKPVEKGKYNTKKVYLKLEDGWTWVDVPLRDLKTEGNFMGHCVGSGGYGEDVKSGTTIIYSLRDAKNEPHITVEYSVTRKSIVQIQGKQNKEPVSKYHAAIGKLIDGLDCKPSRTTMRYVTNPESIVKAYKTLGKSYEDTQMRAVILRNPNCPEAMLRAKAKADKLRFPISRNEKCPEDLLRSFAKDKNSTLLNNVALNPSSPLDLLLSLAKKSSILAAQVANNTSLPVEELQRLALRSGAIASNVFSNETFPLERIRPTIVAGRKKSKRYVLDMLRYMSIHDDDTRPGLFEILVGCELSSAEASALTTNIPAQTLAQFESLAKAGHLNQSVVYYSYRAYEDLKPETEKYLIDKLGAACAKLVSQHTEDSEIIDYIIEKKALNNETADAILENRRFYDNREKWVVSLLQSGVTSAVLEVVRTTYCGTKNKAIVTAVQALLRSSDKAIKSEAESWLEERKDEVDE